MYSTITNQDDEIYVTEDNEVLTTDAVTQAELEEAVTTLNERITDLHSSTTVRSGYSFNQTVTPSSGTANDAAIRYLLKDFTCSKILFSETIEDPDSTQSTGTSQQKAYIKAINAFIDNLVLGVEYKGRYGSYPCKAIKYKDSDTNNEERVLILINTYRGFAIEFCRSTRNFYSAFLYTTRADSITFNIGNIFVYK